MVGKTLNGNYSLPSEAKTFLHLPASEELKFGRDNRKSKAKLWQRIVIAIAFISLLILNLTVVFIAICKNKTVEQLQNEVTVLKRDVDLLKYRYIDDELLQNLADYKNEESDTPPDNNYADYNLDDYEYDNISYDDLILPVKIEDNEDIEASSPASTSPVTVRSKREVLAATIDGVPIISESYAERKQRNKTMLANGDMLKLYETLGKNTEAPPKTTESRKHHDHRGFIKGWASRTYVNNGRATPVLPGAAPTPVMSRTSRVMHTDEDKSKAFRMVVKKSFLKSAGTTGNQRNYQELVESPEATVMPGASGTVQTHRHRKHGGRRANLETMDERHLRVRHALPVVHYNADASKYVYGKHHHYKGNGHLAHPQGLFVDWVPSAWVRNLGMDRFFHMHNGVLTVKDTGLYFIYAQIYYVDEHDLNGYKIYKNDSEIAQCTTMTHTERKLDKRNTCYTATVEYLQEGDRITLKDIETMRYSYFEAGKSFFGLYKISDAKMK